MGKQPWALSQLVSIHVFGIELGFNPHICPRILFLKNEYISPALLRTSQWCCQNVPASVFSGITFWLHVKHIAVRLSLMWNATWGFALCRNSTCPCMYDLQISCLESSHLKLTRHSKSIGGHVSSLFLRFSVWINKVLLPDLILEKTLLFKQTGQQGERLGLVFLYPLGSGQAPHLTDTADSQYGYQWCSVWVLSPVAEPSFLGPWKSHAIL